MAAVKNIKNITKMSTLCIKICLEPVKLLNCHFINNAIIIATDTDTDTV